LLTRARIDARAKEHDMGEMTNAAKTVSLLNDLITLDYDAVSAYEAAIDRLTDGTDKTQLARFMEDHRRHITDLTPLVLEHGGKPVMQADFKEILTKGKVVIGGLMGDKVILEAMKSNEETTNKKYENATREAGIAARVRTVLERNLNDERRHRAWIEQRLATMSRPADTTSRASR
jgi:uncharacterized protein (TIGR02284 family)